MANKIIPDNEFYLKMTDNQVNGFDVVSKFGRNVAVSSTNYQPITGSKNYQTPLVPHTLVVYSDNSADGGAGAGARAVTIQGLDATGVLQTVETSTNGVTPVTVSGTWLRVFRCFVSKSGSYGTQTIGSHVGAITVRSSVATSTTASATWALIDNTDFARGQSQIGAYTIPKGKRGYIPFFHVEVQASRVVSYALFFRENILASTAPFPPVRLVHESARGTSSEDYKPIIPYGPFDELTDLGFLAKTSALTADVICDFNIVLIDK